MLYLELKINQSRDKIYEWECERMCVYPKHYIGDEDLKLHSFKVDGIKNWSCSTTAVWSIGKGGRNAFKRTWQH